MHSGGVIQWAGFRLYGEPCHCSQSVKDCGEDQTHSRAPLASNAVVADAVYRIDAVCDHGEQVIKTIVLTTDSVLLFCPFPELYF